MRSEFEREYRLIRIIFVGSIVCSIFLAFIEALTNPLYILITTVLIVILGIMLLVMSVLHRRGKGVGIFLSLAMINLIFVIPEFGLEVGNFSYETGIQFGYPRPSQFERLKLDSDLFWRLDPSRPNVNSEGFPGEEFVIPKPEDTYRILFLGDSCTLQGYPEEVEASLNEEYASGGLRFESVSLAVYGYSSHQGRILTEMYGSILEPDLVVIYFGWNDHWLAYGAIDAEKDVSTSALSKLYISLHRFKLGQFLFWVSDNLFGGKENNLLESVRVPIDHYEGNLLAMNDFYSRADVPVIYITAPTSHYKLGVPDYLIEMQYARDRESVEELHKAYNDVVRHVVQEAGVYGLDLESTFNAFSPIKMEELFLDDGIHFEEAGIQEVSAHLVEFLEANHLLPLDPASE